MKKEQILNQDLFIWDEKGCHLNGALAYDFFATYGFPVELYTEEVNRLLPAGSAERAKLIARAYDKFKGTNYADKILTN